MREIREREKEAYKAMERQVATANTLKNDALKQNESLKQQVSYV